MPTFNRPDLLERTLSRLICQTWKNIEIIVSDNASTDPRVEEVLQSFSEKDPRITIVRQSKNIGSLNNFFYVLKQSKAEFFMWAADDDYIEPWFVERTLRVLWNNQELAMATFEAQYITPQDLKLPFIAEGKAFRDRPAVDAMDRLMHLIDHNFGNLVYGLFQKKALMQDGEVFWEKSGLHSLNEIPPLMYSAYKGGMVVLPEIGLYKQAPATVHAQVVWEIKGGRLPALSRMTGLRSIRATWGYHAQSLRHIEVGLKLIPLPDVEKNKLRLAANIKLRLHFLYMLIGYKPKFICTNA